MHLDLRVGGRISELEEANVQVSNQKMEIRWRGLNWRNNRTRELDQSQLQIKPVKRVHIKRIRNPIPIP
jgi:hypothetical protein